MTYNVFTGTLNPTQSINQSEVLFWHRLTRVIPEKRAVKWLWWWYVGLVNSLVVCAVQFINWSLLVQSWRIQYFTFCPWHSG